MELPAMEQQPEYPYDIEEDYYSSMKSLHQKLHSIDFI